MQHSFLGLIFNITVLILEYKRAAFAQTFILGYKPIRPSYFYPDHPGHHPPQIVPQQSQEGWLWPADPGCTTTTRTTTTATTVQVPNRRPDIPQSQEGRPPQENSPEINHWFRPVIITNTMTTGGSGNRTTSTTTTLASTTTTSPSTRPPSALAATSQVVQFLPEGDLFTSAPVRKNHIIEPSSGAPMTSAPPVTVSVASATLPTELPANNPVIASPEGNVSLVVADLLPLPVEVAKNGSVENLNLLLPLLPLKAPKTNDID